MKKSILLLPILTLLLTGCLKQTTLENSNQNKTSLANPASENCTQQGGRIEIRTATDSSQIGFCIFSDNSECEEWSYFRNECLPQSEVEDISNQIKQLFIQKYGKNQDEVTVSVNQQTVNYARGSVKFGLNGIGEGGIFLATKVDNQWQLVFDGNGMIPCSEIEEYDFPESMVTDCFDFQ
jgi:putative hemolysin